MINIERISPIISSLNLPAQSAQDSRTASQRAANDTVEISAAAKMLFDSSKDTKIRAVEELMQKIKYDGYPNKSDYYKFMENLCTSL
jgi:hypothetical protein